MRTSIRQVAERAGVSAMTVSNVLRNRTERMAPETRERVLSAVHALDYVPVRTAAQNRHVTTNALGVVFIQEMQGAVGYPTFLGMCARAKQIDHDLTILLRSEPDWVRPGTESQFLDRRCDGFIFVGDSRPEISEALVRHQIPIVECYSVHPPAGVARVLGDNFSGARLATERLIALGHRRLAHLAGPTGNLEAQERQAGFMAAMQAAGLPIPAKCILPTDTWGDLWGFGEDQARADHSGALTLPTAKAALALDVTGIVCTNDLYALAVWRLAEERGLRVPRDLSLTGVDNIIEARQRGLTSVALPFEDIGRAAVDAIMALLNGQSAEEASRTLPPRLIERDSVAAPRL